MCTTIILFLAPSLIVENPLKVEQVGSQQRKNIDGFYLFKALCKKILGRTDYIAQDQSLFAKGDVTSINNISRASLPDFLISSQIVTALKAQSIKPQCEFVVSYQRT